MRSHRHTWLGVLAASTVAVTLIAQTARGVAAVPPPCTTLGPQKIIVILATMPGSPLPTDFTSSDVEDAFFSTDSTMMSLASFWQENSYGAATAEGAIAPGTVGGWYTLDRVYTVDERTQIRAAAIAAADADVDFRQYSRVFIILNGWNATSHWATTGCSLLSSGDGSFNASTSWMVPTPFVENERGARAAIQMGGYNLGLQKANSRDFGTEALGAPGTAGVVEDFDDSFSAMGRSFAHYAASHKSMLGWLSGRVQTITGSGSYTLSPVESAGPPGSVQALKIRRGTNPNNWLWLEYRQPVGNYDTKIAHPFVYGLPPGTIPYLHEADSHIYSGALVYYEDSTTGAFSHLLDMTPQSLPGTSSPLVPDDWLDPVLAGTWTDVYTGLSITTSNPTGTSLTVDVAYGPPLCVQSNPTVTISPASATRKRGQSITYTVTVRNNDTSSCPAQTFSLSSPLPAGWPSSFSQGAVTVPAGSSVPVSMVKTVPSNAQFRAYVVHASAAGGAFSGTGLASITVIR